MASVRYPFLLTWEKSYTPRTAYRYKSSKSKLPTLARAGMVMIKVLNTSFRLLALLTNLKILATLNVLTIVVAPPKLRLVLLDMKTLAIDIITITKSNMFHPSLK